MKMNEHMKANTRRIQLYTWGPTRHPSGDFLVDDAFYTALAEFHADMSARGYYSPFAINHKSEGPEHQDAPASGLTHGRVVNVLKGAAGIEADVYFAEGFAEAFDKGLLDSFSPTHYTKGFTDPHTGKHYKTGLREVSAVRVRHQKNLPGASPWYQMNAEVPEWHPITALEEHMTIVANPPQTTPNTATPATPGAPTQTLEQRFEALAQANEAIRAESAETKKALAEILAKLTPAEPETTTNSEETPDQKRLRELEQRLELQARELKLADARAKITARLPGAPAEQITSLSEMALTVKPEAFEHVLKPLEELAKSKLTPTTAPGITILGEQGSVGGPAGGMTMAKAHQEADAAGVARGAARLTWIKTRYPNLVP